jgi:hypothetical protein
MKCDQCSNATIRVLQLKKKRKQRGKKNKERTSHIQHGHANPETKLGALDAADIHDFAPTPPTPLADFHKPPRETHTIQVHKAAAIHQHKSRSATTKHSNCQNPLFWRQHVQHALLLAAQHHRLTVRQHLQASIPKINLLLMLSKAPKGSENLPLSRRPWTRLLQSHHVDWMQAPRNLSKHIKREVEQRAHLHKKYFFS